MGSSKPGPVLVKLSQSSCTDTLNEMGLRGLDLVEVAARYIDLSDTKSVYHSNAAANYLTTNSLSVKSTKKEILLNSLIPTSTSNSSQPKMCPFEQQQ